MIRRLATLCKTLAVIVVLGASLLTTAQVAAGPAGSPQCTGPGLQPQAYGRCLTTGYFSGQPNVDVHTITASDGSTWQYVPQSYPLQNTYAYFEPWTGGTQWVFPSVTAAGTYTFGGQVYHYAGGATTHNTAYAQLFIAEIQSYLNADFSSTGPNHCVSGAPWLPDGSATPTKTYNPTANATDLNYYLSTDYATNGVSSGSACYNLRRNAVGAAMTIDTMMNQPGSNYSGYPQGIDYAKSVFSQWTQLVQQYDTNGWVNWDFNDVAPPYHLNSTGINYGEDDEIFQWGDTAENASAIVFTDPTNGDAPYTINRSCGNLLGDTSGLPGYDLQPQVTASATYVDPGQAVQFQFTVNDSGQNSSPSVPYKTSYAVTPGPGSGLPSGPTGTKSFATGANSLGNTSVPTGSYSVGTKICATLTVGPPAAYNFSGSRSATSCVYVVARPYFGVKGGDVAAGGVDCATPNNTDTKAGIVSWNQEAAGGYAGAGTNYAALALNHLQDFATGQYTALQPSGLAFANTSDGDVQPSSGLFGGKFDSLACIQDYYGTKPTNAKPISQVNANPGLVGSYYADGPFTLTDVPMPAGDHITVYVNGDLYISDNISFAATYAKLTDIPSLTVIVKGSIYIAPGVTQLDGTYIAQPTSGSSTDGNIYTCATASGSGAHPYSAAALNSSLYNSCQTPLTVDGAFIANQVWLLRTAGSLSTTPAETFNFSPELWLTAPYDSSVTGTTSDDYDAISSLPPVL